jgi:outer membrane protein assembly factor BamB
LKRLKQQLRDSPRDEALKQRIRELDLRLRTIYFKEVSRTESGAWLLIFGAVVLVVASAQIRRIHRTPPEPGRAVDPQELDGLRQRSRWAVAGAGAGFAALLAALMLGPSTAIPRTAAEVDKLLSADGGGPAAPDAASSEELARNWPRFLGPLGNGSSTSALPLAVIAEDFSRSVAWKTSALVAGFNSPIVFGDRVFFSGGDAQKREVLCHDLKSGQLLWRQALSIPQAGPARKEEIPESTGYAPCTMATDGRRVYAIFANGELAAFSLEGRQVWAKNLGPLDNAYGHAISLTTWKDRLLVQLDQGEADAGKSKLLAFDGRTGNVVWQKPRQFGASWASPVVFEASGKPQIVLLSLPFATAYSTIDGAELWKFDCLNGEVTPSAIFAGGLVLVASPSDKLVAIRPDGAGDVTKTHQVWKNEDNVPDVTSPASNGDLVFTITTSGVFTSFDCKDGKKVWEHDFEEEFHASPGIADGKVYLLSQRGRVVIVEAGREFKQLSQAVLPDSFHASPALVGAHLVARGVTNLWCLRAEVPAARNP